MKCDIFHSQNPHNSVVCVICEHEFQLKLSNINFSSSFLLNLFYLGLQEANRGGKEGIFEGSGSLSCELSVTSK